MENIYNNNNDDGMLLEKFNRKDVSAFREVYLYYYNDLYYFASSLYKNTAVASDDIVQDVFLNLWEAEKVVFDDLRKIKAYLFINIKNGFLNYLKHQKHADKYKSALLLDDDYLVSQIVETEIFSFINDAVEFLPEECKKVFTEYLNGLDTKEIAEKLGKSEFTVYKQRKYAIEILKKKLPKDKVLIIMSLLGNL